MRIPMRRLAPIRDPEVIAGLRSHAHEKLFSGPRNCIKTSTSLSYALAKHEAYPNFQSEVIRTEMKTMGAVYDTLNNNLLRYPLSDDRRNPFVFKASSKEEPRPHILFKNGGKMCFAGMDNSDKALGSEMDLIIYSQGERERKMKHISDLLGCMEGGRAGNWVTDKGEVRYCLIVEANPSHKKHILMQRVESGAMEWTKFTHKSHPLFYDWDKLCYSQQGLGTIEGLKRAYPEGFERDRMVYGYWTNATGLVYPQYKPEKHHVPIDRADIASDAIWRMSCDFGRTSSTGFYAESGDHHIRFKEIYWRDLSPNDHIAKIKHIQSTYNIPEIECVFADHEHNGRAILQDAGFHVVPADKSVSMKDGIDLVRWGFVNDKIKINENSVEEPCPELAGGINCLADELTSLTYKPEDKQTGSKRDDLPDPECEDHASDDLRYYSVGTMRKVELPSFLL